MQSQQELNEFFKYLTTNGKHDDPGRYPGTVKELPNGSVVRMQPSSKSGGSTIDTTLPDEKIYKVHIKK